MSKLIIDERDLRCTILEGIRNTDARLDPEAFAKAVADAVVACGDPVPTTEQGWVDRGVVAGKMIATTTFLQSLQELQTRYVRSLSSFAATAADLSVEPVEVTYQSDERCLDCGTVGPHHCSGAPK